MIAKPCGCTDRDLLLLHRDRAADPAHGLEPPRPAGDPRPRRHARRVPGDDEGPSGDADAGRGWPRRPDRPDLSPAPGADGARHARLPIALLDAWATVGDVLTFYQERIANEGYLRTATERRSVLELARLVGYAPSRASRPRSSCPTRWTRASPASRRSRPARARRAPPRPASCRRHSRLRKTSTRAPTGTICRYGRRGRSASPSPIRSPSTRSISPAT